MALVWFIKCPQTKEHMAASPLLHTRLVYRSYPLCGSCLTSLKNLGVGLLGCPLSWLFSHGYLSCAKNGTDEYPCEEKEARVPMPNINPGPSPLLT